MVVACSRFPILNETSGEVVGVGGSPAAARVLDACQQAVVVILVGNGVSVLVGFLRDALIDVVGVAYEVVVAVFQPGKTVVAILGVSIACQGLGSCLDGGAEAVITVGEVIFRSAGGDLRQIIVRIGVGSGKVLSPGACCRRDQAVHFVIGVRGRCPRPVGVLHGLQFSGLGIRSWELELKCSNSQNLNRN